MSAAAASAPDVFGDHCDFATAWNALPRAERTQLKRIVRMGRRIDDPAQRPLAAAYARYQSTRPWIRFFWLWFAPGLVIAVGIASRIHPLATGIVIALGAQGAWAWFNLKRLARDSAARHG